MWLRNFIFLMFIGLCSLKLSVSTNTDSSDMLKKDVPSVYSYYRIDDMLFLNTDRAGQKYRAYRWPRGHIPFSFAPGYTKLEMNEIRLAMEYIEEFTCIRFHPRKKKSDVNYLHFRKLSGKCSSFVGNIQKGPQQVSLDPESKKCGSPSFPGHVLHELVHAIGFFHEHARNDRAHYIDIKYENLPHDDRTKKNYNTNEDNNLDAEYFGVPYNYGSIMHYSRRAGSINGKDTIVPKKSKMAKSALRGRLGQREKLTYGDVRMIQSMYKSECPGAVDLSDIPDTEDIPDVEDWMEDRVVDPDTMEEIPVEEITEISEGILDEVTEGQSGTSLWSTLVPGEAPGTKETTKRVSPAARPSRKPPSWYWTSQRPTSKPPTTQRTTEVTTKTPNLFNLIRYAVQNWGQTSG